MFGAWFCLFFFISRSSSYSQIYLVWSLNSVRLFTPVINAQQIELTSLNTIPALLDAMDTERARLAKKRRPTGPCALCPNPPDGADQSRFPSILPLLLPSAEESRRRVLAHQWISDIGDATMKEPMSWPGTVNPLDFQSRAMLDELNRVTAQVRIQEQAC